MIRFKARSSASLPPVSTASLPDIVFMLLFFFMTVTTIQEKDLKVLNQLPDATEIKKLEKKDRLIYIHIGPPKQQYRSVYGAEPQIQLDDSFARVSDIGPYVLQKREALPAELRSLVTVVLKVDEKAGMGLINDVKQELRKVHALKINYATIEQAAAGD